MNWSLMLNALLLIGVVIAIVRTLQSRRQEDFPKSSSNRVASSPPTTAVDEIIAVRKLDHGFQPAAVAKPTVMGAIRQQSPIRPSLKPAATPSPTPVLSVPSAVMTPQEDLSHAAVSSVSAETIMMFLLAKSQRQLAGYELLQAVLAVGYRFGEGGLFHRHQFPNGQGPIVCSLAAATPSGVFDLQNIGGFVVNGLCLYMEISGNQEIDAERFDTMLDTARSLSDSLDTHLLDECRELLSETSIARYHQKLLMHEQSIAVE